MPVKILCMLILSLGMNALAQKKSLRAATPSQQISTEQNELTHFFSDMKFGFYFASKGAEYVKTQDQRNQSIGIESYLFLTKKNKFTLAYEANRWDESNRAGNVFVERRNNSHMLWGTYDLLSAQYFNRWMSSSLFVGAGGGASLDTILTRMMDEETKDQGQYQWKAGGILGVDTQLSFVSLRLEGQILSGANRNPNPGYAGYARFGVIF